MTKQHSRNDERVHVLHVIGALHTGGAEKMLINFLAAVDKQRYRHTVLCLTARGDMASLVADLDIPVVLMPVRMRRLPLDVNRLARWMREQQVRIVHSHMFFASFWSRLAGLRAGVDLMVTTEHGKEPWKKAWQSWFDRYLSRRTHHHIAVSDDVRNIRIARDGIRPDKITLIPNGVPIPDLSQVAQRRAELRRELGLPPTAPVIGSVGRMIEAKAYPDLLKAVGLARAAVPDLQWLQIGDGPGREELMAQAREAGLQDAVVFAGRRSDIGDLLGVMDVWVMSSIREGLPVALLEAMAAGKPIVATDVGGIPDAVDHDVEALLVPARNPVELATAIGRVVEDQELARRLARAARARAERDYGIGAVARRIEAIYDEGMAAGRRDR